MKFAKDWWKYLTIILLFYSLIMGLSIPLRMGITSGRDQLSLRMGTINKVQIETYNSNFQNKPEEIRIKLNAQKAICAQSIQVIDAHNINASFMIPSLELSEIKSPYPLLEIWDPSNGYAFSAVSLQEFKDSSNINQPINYCKTKFLSPKKGLHFPFLNILEETIRNLFYHVPMWFGMMLLLLVSVIYSILYLRNPQNIELDIKASSFAQIGVLFGILGVLTGALWAKNTWGSYWSWDVKQNTSAVALLIYLAYFVLRSSFDDTDRRARIAATYNIFAFSTLIPLLYIIPRMVNSLHPGAEGNPAFSSYDLDSQLRWVFYPSVVGWILLGVWLAQISLRLEILRNKKLETL